MVDPDTLLLVALFSEILGVLVLALPELLPLFGWTFFGRLMIASEQLEYGGLSPGDTGFKELVSIHNESQPNIEITPDDVNRILYGPGFTWVNDPNETEGLILPWPFSDSDYLGFVVESRVRFDYNEGYPDELPWEVSTSSKPPGHVYPKIVRRLDWYERLMRVGGLALIGMGFIFQFGATLAG